MSKAHVNPPSGAGLWRRSPPAVFPPIMGLFGLGLAWRHGARVFGLPAGLAEMILGAVTLLWLFAVLTYAVKLARRPGVVMDDLKTLPGRAGLAAMVLCLLLFAAVLVPYSSLAALIALILGLMLHVALALLMIRALVVAPPEGRAVTPIWHLSFVGAIIAGLSATPLGLPALGELVLWGTIPVAVVIWGTGVVQLIHRIPPAPLRPLLAIHLSPACLFGTVSAINGHPGLAVAFAVLGGFILCGLVLTARWITEAGFNALWGAFTFPLAAYASLLLTLGGGWAIPGALVLSAASIMIPLIAFKVLQAWARGQLAAKTNAAMA